MIELRRDRLGLAGAILLVGVTSLAAQSEAAVEQLAPILMAEDTRTFDPGLFQRAMAQPDPLVRKTAIRALGRIRDVGGEPLLITALRDRDSTLVAEAAFALGQIADTTTFSALSSRLADNTYLLPAAVNEIVTAMVKIGGPTAAAACADLLRSAGFAEDTVRSRSAATSCLRESWRLGALAPVEQIRTFLTASEDNARGAAYYVLGRLHRVADANQMLAGLRESSAFARSAAVRALTGPYADSAHLEPSTITRQLDQVVADPDPALRIQSLRALGTFHGQPVAAMLLPGLEDQVPNVAVTAAEAIGNAGDTTGVKGLLRVLDGKGVFALRRAALLSLAQLAPAAFAERSRPWAASQEWRDRAAAADGWGRVKPFGAAPLAPFLSDRDARVVGAALQTWSDAIKGPEPGLLTTARQLLGAKDAVVRSIAADAVGRAADPADLPALRQVLAASQRDSISDAALSALNAILAINASGDAGHRAITAGFLESVPRPSEYLLRRWAADHWPELADRWSPIEPVDAKRTLQDYRDVAQHFLAVPGPEQRPHVFIETAKGTVELELAGPDAPLTVSNFLRLVDRHYFDNQRWHRVVPDFVAQAGDPRGDGWGGPGWAIRDEVNPLRYAPFTVGMALSGPETGGSQFFITLSPAPHLNGIYTVFGKVANGAGMLLRLSQGELITSIHR